jgi:hypothetical protein
MHQCLALSAKSNLSPSTIVLYTALRRKFDRHAQHLARLTIYLAAFTTTQLRARALRQLLTLPILRSLRGMGISSPAVRLASRAPRRRHSPRVPMCQPSLRSNPSLLIIPVLRLLYHHQIMPPKELPRRFGHSVRPKLLM